MMSKYIPQSNCEREITIKIKIKDYDPLYYVDENGDKTERLAMDANGIYEIIKNFIEGQLQDYLYSEMLEDDDVYDDDLSPYDTVAELMDYELLIDNQLVQRGVTLRCPSCDWLNNVTYIPNSDCECQKCKAIIPLKTIMEEKI